MRSQPATQAQPRRLAERPNHWIKLHEGTAGQGLYDQRVYQFGDDHGECKEAGGIGHRGMTILTRRTHGAGTDHAYKPYDDEARRPFE